MARILALDTHPVRHRAALYQQLGGTYGHDVTVLYGADANTKHFAPGETEHRFEWELSLLGGYKAHFGERIRRGDQLNIDRLHCKKLGRTVLRTRPELILWSDLHSRFALEAATWLWPLSIPWVLRLERLGFGPEPMPWVGNLREALRRRIYRRAESIAYVGERARQHFTEFGVPKSKQVFSPFGIVTAGLRTEESDRAALRGLQRTAWQVPDSHRVLLYLGSPTTERDAQSVVEAVRSLHPRLRDQTRVVFPDTEPLRSAIQERALRQPVVAVNFCQLAEPANDSTLWPSAAYHGADMAVLPCSDHAIGWGSALNGALAHGLPCLASDRVGGSADLIVTGITGHLFEADSATALAEAVARMWSYTGAPGLRSRCRDHAGRYSLGEAGAGLNRAIKSALSYTSSQASSAVCEMPNGPQS